MKTLTKILSVTALVVLCVCLFTLTAFAAEKTVNYVAEAKQSTCADLGNKAYVIANGDYYLVSNPSSYSAGTTYDDATYTELADANKKTEADTKETALKPTNHVNLTKIPAVADSCTAMGHDDLWFCSGCGMYYTSEANAWANSGGTTTMPTHSGTPSHSWGTPVPASAATCQHDGNVQYVVCSVCGAIADANPPTKYFSKMSDTVVPKAGHDWSAWEIVKAPTNVSPGQQKRTCKNCGEVEYELLDATGITDGEKIYYVIPVHDTWLRGEEALTFESDLIAKLNEEAGRDANYIGVRIGTSSLYENSYDTFDFWSWDQYVKLGDKTMQSLREGEYKLWIYDKRHPDVYTNSCTFWVVDVPTLEAYSTDKHVVNSSKSLRFIASEEIDPNSVMVGSKKLYDSNDFFVSNDRKNITLSADFLNNRQTGTYTISAVTKDGRTIKTNFYILTTAQASSSPRTGDESQIGLWAAFLLLSGAAVVVLVPKLRKQGVK